MLALVPLKSFTQTKRRLAPLLTASERAEPIDAGTHGGAH